MALIDKLNKDKSVYSNLNGGPAPDNFQSLKDSKLHFQYSINGKPKLNVKGTTPSEYDLNGVNPTSANSAKGVNPLNDTFSKGTYKNNVPEGKSF